MRFLVDESCDYAVGRALRNEGFDVLAVFEAIPGAEDEKVIELAKKEGRILLPEDKDFGRLAFLSGRAEIGVVLLRFAARARFALCEAVLNLISREGSKLERVFVVL